MKKSNIFALIELSKLVHALELEGEKTSLKNILKLQSSYFNILESKHFSDNLIGEWTDIQRSATRDGVKKDENGSIVMNAARNTIEALSESECYELARRICSLKNKVKDEFI